MEEREEHILEYAGSFRLLRKVADGGMATVYEAEQLGPAGFAKRVALKVIHPGLLVRQPYRDAEIGRPKAEALAEHRLIVRTACIALAASRSGVTFEPFHLPRAGRWVADVGIEYASTIEYNELIGASVFLDSELLRARAAISRDLSPRTFILAEAELLGAYAGVFDGFLEWYHGLLGIEIPERDRRPRNDFLYAADLPEGVEQVAAAVPDVQHRLAVLKALADQGEGKPKAVADAIKKYGIDPEKADPTTV
mgnify:CR=1 FL=1